MSANFRRLQVIAAAALLPFVAAACGSDESEGTITSVGASAPVEPRTSQPKAEPSAVAPVVVTYEAAESAYTARRYDDAVSLFTTYTGTHPDNAWGHYMLGLSSWKSGNLARAAESFNRALDIDSSHVKSLLNSSRVYLELNQPVEAHTRIERALAIDPISAEGIRLLARSLYNSGDVDGAIDAYREALTVDERDVWSMNNLGLIYIELERPDEALAPLARAVELRGNAPVFQNNLGTALERTGHYSAARQAFEATLAADSTYGKASISLARVIPLAEESVPDSVDLAALAQHFQMQVRMWKEAVPRPVTDSAVATDLLVAPEAELLPEVDVAPVGEPVE